MNNTFLSIITVVQNHDEIQLIPDLLDNLYSVLKENFSDFEIILVNNTNGRDFSRTLEPLDDALKHNIFQLNLSSAVNKNHAFLAGLDRANGDYTVIFEFDFYQKASIVLDLFEKSKKGNDIVYLQAKNRQSNLRGRFFYKLFYHILKNYSDLQIDEKAHDTRIISRRALNSLLRLRENLRYMKALYPLVGYKTASIVVDEPLQHDPSLSFSEKFRTSLVAITSFTTFLRSMMLWIFIVSILFMGVVIFNAVKVKLSNYDVFGEYHEALPGWTFIVVLMSIFFAITCLNLYIMSIYLSNIYNEIKQRPLYIIESVRRF